MAILDEHPARFFWRGANLFADRGGNIFDQETGLLVSGVHEIGGQKVYSLDALEVDKNPMAGKLGELLMNDDPPPPEFFKGRGGKPSR